MALDWRNPEYSAVFEERARILSKLRSDPKLLAAAMLHYRDHPWDFVKDWGMTFEPRNLERGLISSIPFIPFPKQMEFMEWMHNKWRSGERGLVEKSRDCGVTWLSVGMAVAYFLFVDGFAFGFGSRKEELVDKRGDPKCIFEKIRFFLEYVPAEFMPPDYNPRQHSAHMRIFNPNTGASITGEAGDEIGRGGRTSIYVVDEAAFVERQNKVDAALSQNTNCQIDVSTPNGSGNEFYKKRQRFNNTDKIFIFDWRDDPRKDDDWYARQKEEQDEVTIAQEIDRDYNASAENVFVPAKWVIAAVDAHIKLGFEPTGIRATGFDPADVGDAKAVVNRYGSVITEATQLKQGDITQAMPWAFNIADQFRADVMVFDGDGMGAPAMKITLQQRSAGRLRVVAYHGSAEVQDPDLPYKASEDDDKSQYADMKTNKDAFANFRAQSWTWVRDRFQATYEAVQRAESGQIVNADPENLISLSSDCTNLHELMAELSRPMRIFTPNGKIKVESKPAMKKRQVDSPNLADALVMSISAKPPAVKKSKPLQFRSHTIHDSAVGY